MNNDHHNREPFENSGEFTAMLGLIVVVVIGVFSLGEWLDLSGIHVAKIAVAYVILGGMVVDKTIHPNDS